MRPNHLQRTNTATHCTASAFFSHTTMGSFALGGTSCQIIA